MPAGPVRQGKQGGPVQECSFSCQFSSRSNAVTSSWDSVCWCDRIKMAQQCVVICS
ncbi:MAG: hypothetical protein ACK56F_13995 [bacterium]